MINPVECADCYGEGGGDCFCGNNCCSGEFECRNCDGTGLVCSECGDSGCDCSPLKQLAEQAE